MNNPCHGCTNRTILCHSGCEPYNDWKQFKQEESDYHKANQIGFVSDQEFNKRAKAFAKHKENKKKDLR